jgi:ribosomal-protein-alanine N-acetyltransferase
MISLLSRLFTRREPTLSDASTRDAAAIAALHAKSFQRGWSEDEVEGLLAERNVIGHRALAGTRLAGFILSRLAADEAEILSVAVDRAYQGRGLGRRLLMQHLGRLAGYGAQTVFLEVG